jgi:protein Tex
MDLGEDVLMQSIVRQIAQEIKVKEAQVQSAVSLLDGGATVPFIARYRKEATDGLDDIQLRELEYRLGYLREMAERREAILKSIEAQGKLTPELQAAIAAAPTKQELEDLYLPFKPKRRTKGMIAREAGIEPLADLLFADPGLSPLAEAEKFTTPVGSIEGADFSSALAVLDGVRDILSERWAEDAGLVQSLREWLWSSADFASKLIEGKNENDAEIAKFRDYFDYNEPIAKVPSHRALAVFRGRAAEYLEAKLAVPAVESAQGATNSIATVASKPVSLAEGRIALHLKWSHAARPADDLIRKCVSWAWKVKLSLSLERDLFARLREEAEKVAIKVFAQNVRDLLLAAPAGPKAVMGLDPGIRTGVKVAVVDATGKLLETSTVYPHEPRKDWDGSLHTLQLLAVKYGVELIAIGNGTASRETDKLAGDLIKMLSKDEQTIDYGSVRDAQKSLRIIQKVVVSESGASIYSASEYASQEMPDVDVSLRGAASIARRLQDPLSELVKIDPKSIGVGQYQHDVNQSELIKGLDAVVEDCVNGVGVDLNTASVPLLSRVAGLSGSVAKAVVRHREANGAFKSRADLLAVSGLGAKTFEQCAGFLRIQGGSNPLDATGVHPESYEVVEKLLALVKKPIAEVMGRSEVLKSVKPEQITTEKAGALTVQDILAELEKPGRDPRGTFVAARLSDGIEDIKHLVVGMVLEGTVSNVAAFGAFVDLGVHQDGLIHVSQLSHKFITDAREVVRAGQVVKVKVMEVDVVRKRIGLSMKLDAAPVRPSGERNERAARDNRGAVNAYGLKQEEVRNSSMADKLAALRR